MFVGTTVVSMVGSPTSPVAEGTGLVSATVAVPISPVPETPVTSAGANVSLACALIDTVPKAVVPAFSETKAIIVCPPKSKTVTPFTIFLIFTCYCRIFSI